MASLAERMKLFSAYIGISIRTINDEHITTLQIPESLLLMMTKYVLSGDVVIQHNFGSHLRVMRPSKANVQGRRGFLARWSLEVHGFNVFKFKNWTNGKYLRITNKGIVHHVDGNGDKFSLFTYDPVDKSLESVQFPGCYLAVREQEITPFGIFRSSDSDALEYAFDLKIIFLNRRVNPVGIRNAFDGLLRLRPEDESQVCGDGQREESTHWEVEWFDNETILRFKSTKSGRYLRFVQRGTAVNVKGSGGCLTRFYYDAVKGTLESVQYPRSFLAIRKEDLSVIAVKPQSISHDDGNLMRFELVELTTNNKESSE